MFIILRLACENFSRIAVKISFVWVPKRYFCDCLVIILKFYTVPMFLHAVRNFVNQKAFSSQHVSIFLPRKYDVISQLRHSYAKGPFCVARLSHVFTYMKKYKSYFQK